MHKDAICEIDFVIRESYTEEFRNVAKFDYIVSCHVLEHMPRLIEFFQDTVNILNKHGKMYMFLPDSRYCFDHFRSPTSFAELYYIHTQGLKFAPWQALDSAGMSVPLNDPKKFAADKRLFPLLAQRRPFAKVKECFERALDGESANAHYTVFTPASFLLLLHEMTRAGVFPYKLAAFFPTPKYDNTFGAVLDAYPELPDSEELTIREMGRLRKEMVRLVDYEEDLKKT
jgi:SAM-dependent methyltransferase